MRRLEGARVHQHLAAARATNFEPKPSNIKQLTSNCWQLSNRCATGWRYSDASYLQEDAGCPASKADTLHARGLLEYTVVPSSRVVTASKRLGKEEVGDCPHRNSTAGLFPAMRRR